MTGASPRADSAFAAAAERLIAAACELRDSTAVLAFGPPVAYVYNPLAYAFAMHTEYLRRFAGTPKEVVFFGMNPGPWGMAQTGIPFGEVHAVREWLQIAQPIASPNSVHPRRPVEGLNCARSEVSGKRLWGAFHRRFRTPSRFFARHFVANYCPLLFIEHSGRNRTPDKLPKPERSALTTACDRHAAAVLTVLQPRYAIGVGRYAREQLDRVVAGLDAGEFTARDAWEKGKPQVVELLHPSPANPRANRGWEAELHRRMRELGLW